MTQLEILDRVASAPLSLGAQDSRVLGTASRTRGRTHRPVARLAAAYRQPDAPLTAAADWHDRWLPGLLHRLEHGAFAVDCSDIQLPVLMPHTRELLEGGRHGQLFREPSSTGGSPFAVRLRPGRLGESQRAVDATRDAEVVLAQFLGQQFRGGMLGSR